MGSELLSVKKKQGGNRRAFLQIAKGTIGEVVQLGALDGNFASSMYNLHVHAPMLMKLYLWQLPLSS